MSSDNTLKIVHCVVHDQRNKMEIDNSLLRKSCNEFCNNTDDRLHKLCALNSKEETSLTNSSSSSSSSLSNSAFSEPLLLSSSSSSTLTPVYNSVFVVFMPNGPRPLLGLDICYYPHNIHNNASSTKNNDSDAANKNHNTPCFINYYKNNKKTIVNESKVKNKGWQRCRANNNERSTQNKCAQIMRGSSNYDNVKYKCHIYKNNINNNIYHDTINYSCRSNVVNNNNNKHSQLRQYVNRVHVRFDSLTHSELLFIPEMTSVNFLQSPRHYIHSVSRQRNLNEYQHVSLTGPQPHLHTSYSERPLYKQRSEPFENFLSSRSSLKQKSSLSSTPVTQRWQHLLPSCVVIVQLKVANSNNSSRNNNPLEEMEQISFAIGAQRKYYVPPQHTHQMPHLPNSNKNNDNIVNEVISPHEFSLFVTLTLRDTKNTYRFIASNAFEKLSISSHCAKFPLPQLEITEQWYNVVFDLPQLHKWLMERQSCISGSNKKYKGFSEEQVDELEREQLINALDIKNKNKVKCENLFLWLSRHFSVEQINVETSHGGCFVRRIVAVKPNLLSEEHEAHHVKTREATEKHFCSETPRSYYEQEPQEDNENKLNLSKYLSLLRVEQLIPESLRLPLEVGGVENIVVGLHHKDEELEINTMQNTFNAKEMKCNGVTSSQQNDTKCKAEHLSSLEIAASLRTCLRPGKAEHCRSHTSITSDASSESIFSIHMPPTHEQEYKNPELENKNNNQLKQHNNYLKSKRVNAICNEKQTTAQHDTNDISSRNNNIVIEKGNHYSDKNGNTDQIKEREQNMGVEELMARLRARISRINNVVNEHELPKKTDYTESKTSNIHKRVNSINEPIETTRKEQSTLNAEQAIETEQQLQQHEEYKNLHDISDKNTIFVKCMSHIDEQLSVEHSLQSLLPVQQEQKAQELPEMPQQTKMENVNNETREEVQEEEEQQEQFQEPSLELNKREVITTWARDVEKEIHHVHSEEVVNDGNTNVRRGLVENVTHTMQNENRGKPLEESIYEVVRRPVRRELTYSSMSVAAVRKKESKHDPVDINDYIVFVNEEDQRSNNSCINNVKSTGSNADTVLKSKTFNTTQIMKDNKDSKQSISEVYLNSASIKHTSSSDNMQKNSIDNTGDDSDKNVKAVYSNALVESRDVQQCAGSSGLTIFRTKQNTSDKLPNPLQRSSFQFSDWLRLRRMREALAESVNSVNSDNNVQDDNVGGGKEKEHEVTTCKEQQDKDCKLNYRRRKRKITPSENDSVQLLTNTNISNISGGSNCSDESETNHKTKMNGQCANHLLNSNQTNLELRSNEEIWQSSLTRRTCPYTSARTDPNSGTTKNYNSASNAIITATRRKSTPCALPLAKEQHTFSKTHKYAHEETISVNNTVDTKSEMFKEQISKNEIVDARESNSTIHITPTRHNDREESKESEMVMTKEEQPEEDWETMQRYVNLEKSQKFIVAHRKSQTVESTTHENHKSVNTSDNCENSNDAMHKSTCSVTNTTRENEENVNLNGGNEAASSAFTITSTRLNQFTDTAPSAVNEWVHSFHLPVHLMQTSLRDVVGRYTNMSTPSSFTPSQRTNMFTTTTTTTTVDVNKSENSKSTNSNVNENDNVNKTITTLSNSPHASKDLEELTLQEKMKLTPSANTHIANKLNKIMQGDLHKDNNVPLSSEKDIDKELSCTHETIIKRNRVQPCKEVGDTWEIDRAANFFNFHYPVPQLYSESSTTCNESTSIDSDTQNIIDVVRSERMMEGRKEIKQESV